MIKPVYRPEFNSWGDGVCECVLNADRAIKAADRHKSWRIAIGIQGTRFQEAQFANFIPGPDKKALSVAQTFVHNYLAWAIDPEQPQPHNLVFGSPIYGNGKTFLCAAIVNNLLYYAHIVAEAMDRGKPAILGSEQSATILNIQSMAAILVRLRNARFVTAKEFHTHAFGIADPERKQAWERLIGARLLIIDDLGKDHIKDQGDGISWQAENYHAMADHRYRLQLPTIITTNLPKPWEHMGESAASRLFDGAHIITMRGKSRRAPDILPDEG